MPYPIQTVIFDIGNVILRSTHQIMFAILWDLGVRPDKVALFFHNKAYGEFARGKITGKQFADEVRVALDAPWLTNDQIRAAHDAHIWSVDQAVVVIMRKIKEKNIPLGFVTTTNRWQTERERELIHLVDNFGPIIRSHKIGKTKTDEDAWPIILDELARRDIPVVDRRAILFVDDAPANLNAAHLIGLATHLYDPTPVIGVQKLEEDLRRRGLLD